MLSIDANLRKIFARYFFGSRFAILPEEIIKNLEIQFRKTNISGRDINNALMDFGSTFTTFDTTKKFEYPLEECKWYKTGGKLEQEHKAKSITLPTGRQEHKEGIVKTPPQSDAPL